jgi:ABC-type Zn uptake system ZnuABC Zn-binding protein ZnuA
VEELLSDPEKAKATIKANAEANCDELKKLAEQVKEDAHK